MEGGCASRVIKMTKERAGKENVTEYSDPKTGKRRKITTWTPDPITYTEGNTTITKQELGNIKIEDARSNQMLLSPTVLLRIHLQI